MKKILLTLAMILFSLPAYAQDDSPKEVTNQNRTGDLPFSQRIGTDVEGVDVSSGQLTVRIPIVSQPGRGLRTPFFWWR